MGGSAQSGQEQDDEDGSDELLGGSALDEGGSALDDGGTAELLGGASLDGTDELLPQSQHPA